MEKLNDYEITLEDLDEEAAKDEIRSNVMTFLGEINTQMTELLQKKAKLADGETLEECDIQTLEIINKAKVNKAQDLLIFCENLSVYFFYV